MGMTALEAWTRDDPAPRALYESVGFRQVESYWHVYMDGTHFHNSVPQLHAVETFAHYLGSDLEALRPHCRRIYACARYQLEL